MDAFNGHTRSARLLRGKMLWSAILGLAAALAAASPASADGALAIGGNTAEVATNGIVFGIGNNWDTKDEAEAEAMRQCLAQKGAPAAVATCKLVEDFRHEWVVIALDPAVGTPGVGWSIDVDKMTAERNALDQCKASSPDARKAYCEVDRESSDTKP
jgi:hypothetical protein